MNLKSVAVSEIVGFAGGADLDLRVGSRSAMCYHEDVGWLVLEGMLFWQSRSTASRAPSFREAFKHQDVACLCFHIIDILKVLYPD